MYETQGSSWIWGGKNPRPVNSYRYFRREFAIDRVPDTAEVLCFAEFRYKLYVNGVFVQVGPTSCQPSHRLLDRHDVTAFLHEGENCIGYEVYCPGVMTGQWSIVNPALFSVLLMNKCGEKIVTDSRWKTIKSEAWRHPTQFCGYAKGFHEWHNTALVPDGWSSAGFDESGWEESFEIPFYPYGNCENLKENYMGRPTLLEHLPVGLLKKGLASGIVTGDMEKEEACYYTATRNRWLKMMGKWNLYDLNTPLEDELLPEPVVTLMKSEEHLQAPAGTIEKHSDGSVLPITFNIPSQGHPFAVFDLGTVKSGMLTLDIESESGGIADIGWDDRVDENGRLQVFRATPNCDRVEFAAGRFLWDGFFERGARYLQVVLRDFSGRVTIHKTGIRETLTPIRTKNPAIFKSDNQLLNSIWEAAVETTRQYMNGSASGDPVRERCHWIHDDTMAMRMAFYCFGETNSWRRALELTSQSQHNDGFFPVLSPGHFEDYNMVTSSCYWIVQVAEYCRHTGEFDFGREMSRIISKNIDYELRFAGKDGLLYETPGRRFLSWADGEPRRPYKKGEIWNKKTRKTWGDFFSPVTRGYNAIINTYWLWSLREASDLAGKIGDVSLQNRYAQVYSRGLKAFEEIFWEEDTGLYRDNVAFDSDGNENSPTFCESTLFLMMRAGIIGQAKGLKCLDKIMSPDFVCCRTSGGVDLGSLPVFLLQAGETSKALEYYLELWGEPVKNGTTTCGEEFFQTGGNSDCHIHGATPARDFLEYIAGIQIAAPGWKEVVFAPPAYSPDMPDLSASVPTPFGSIEVRIGKENGKIIYSYKCPKEINCRVQPIEEKDVIIQKL